MADKDKFESKPLHELTEGPYYKDGSPDRRAIAKKDTPGEKLLVEGHVFGITGKPISKAWLDFWQADGK